MRKTCSKWIGTCPPNPGPISENGFPRQGSYDTTHPACLQGPEGPAWAQGPMGPLGCMRAIPPEGYPPFSNAWGFTKGGIAPGGIAFQGLRCSKWVGTCLQHPGPISETSCPRQGSYDTTHPACLQDISTPLTNNSWSTEKYIKNKSFTRELENSGVSKKVRFDW